MRPFSITRLFGLALTLAVMLSAANAGAGHGGWIKDKDNGCALWIPHPVGGETASWSGPCKDGRAEGRGFFRHFQSGSLRSIYEGPMTAGKADGKGASMYSDIGRYVGGWRDSKQHGEGVYVWSDGTRYEGAWRDGKFHGRGVLSSADGTRYDGEFQDGLKHGHGIYTWANGNRHEGGFRDNKAHGSGVCKIKGREFVCHWVDGKRVTRP